MRVGAAPGEDGAGTITLEVWEVPVRHFGELVAEVPAPLAAGSVKLVDGSRVKGLVCEPVVPTGATDITRHDGWARLPGKPAVLVASLRGSAPATSAAPGRRAGALARQTGLPAMG